MEMVEFVLNAQEVVKNSHVEIQLCTGSEEVEIYCFYGNVVKKAYFYTTNKLMREGAKLNKSEVIYDPNLEAAMKHIQRLIKEEGDAHDVDR